MARLLCKRDGDCCWYCGKPFEERGKRSISIEHLIPKASGIEKWAPWNLVVAHRKCNGRAANRPVREKFALRDRLRYGR